MEVERSEPPVDGFLEGVRKLCDDNNIILIFDECTSGFRETYGGLHKKYNIEPDMAMFGKALGNGYAITAIIGRREIMEAAQTSFISSTFWTERIGPTAALKTLDIMHELKSWEIITKKGLEIKRNWLKLANKYGLQINIGGLSALPNFSFKSKNNNEYKTLISQEMLKNNFLAANSVYVCTEHNQSVIDSYFVCLEDIFSLIAECEQGKPIKEYLNNESCHKGFERLN